MIQVLDHGYVKRVDSWGSDQMVIESARMSTDGGFKGWDAEYRMKCPNCGAAYMMGDWDAETCAHCTRGTAHKELVHPGDAKLLRFLWKEKHMTPFEMAGLTIEVKAPLFVFREWHRHRTQGYSEMSARYVPLPDENYVPTIERIVTGAQMAGANRQAQGTKPLQTDMVDSWLDHLKDVYARSQRVYEMGITLGIPKELARLPVPVARYSRMRATANLRNWLGFLQLRDTKHAPGAQWEIRQFADAVALIVSQHFPRTFSLFDEGAK